MGSLPLVRSTMPNARLTHLVRSWDNQFDPTRGHNTTVVLPWCQGNTVGWFFHPDCEEFDGESEQITCKKCRHHAERL